MNSNWTVRRQLCRFVSGLSLLIFCSSSLGSQLAESESQQDKFSNPSTGGIIANMMIEHDTAFMLYPYESNYLLTTYTSNLNKEPIKSYDWADNAQKVEAKFQISLGFPIWKGVLGDNSLLAASYTQRSWWQAFNHKNSSPFRETNYEPQLFLAWLTDWRLGNWTLREFESGFNHQSNGRSELTSRSWNRIYMRFSAVNGNWLVDLKPWLRIKESGRKDDNSDIAKYMGYYRAKIGYRWGDAIFSVDGHYNWSSGYGGAEAGWSYPITKNVRFYTQVFSGYGESMIDYNQKQHVRIGAGVTLNDLF